ncbi:MULTISPECIES: nucleotide disphospho-sugar-binding domain-containing protein [unclassified Kitasatospora]|uniref:nucleotide disphospho-sugar-binding domain-containing protein n=1 Tax=unclassified Kitasatospora TaxID=2633591 RepID=UPI0033CF968F
MRVLSMAAPGSGLFLPTVPLAWALRTAGHEVLVANNGQAAETLVAAGLPAVDVCPGRDVFGEFMAASHAINMTPPGEPRPRRGGLGLFGEEMAEGLLKVAEEFRPDLVLSTLEQGAGPLVATALGVPYVEQSVRLAWAGSDEQATTYRRSIAQYLEPTRAKLGLDEPASAAAAIDVRPPSMGGHDDAAEWSMRYVPYNESRLLPEWALAAPSRPRVCLTLGSVLPLSGELDELSAFLQECGGLDVELILAMGEDQAAALGPVPDNVRVAGWVPLSTLLPTCAAIVHHGGAGTALTALVHGVPQLVVPRLADQPANAAVIAARGVGLALAPHEATATAVKDGLLRLLDAPDHRQAAREVQAEIASRPSPAALVTRLEELVAGH